MLPAGYTGGNPTGPTREGTENCRSAGAGVILGNYRGVDRGKSFGEPIGAKGINALRCNGDEQNRDSHAYPKTVKPRHYGKILCTVKYIAEPRVPLRQSKGKAFRHQKAVSLRGLCSLRATVEPGKAIVTALEALGDPLEPYGASCLPFPWYVLSYWHSGNWPI